MPNVHNTNIRFIDVPLPVAANVRITDVPCAASRGRLVTSASGRLGLVAMFVLRTFARAPVCLRGREPRGLRRCRNVRNTNIRQPCFALPPGQRSHCDSAHTPQSRRAAPNVRITNNRRSAPRSGARRGRRMAMFVIRTFVRVGAPSGAGASSRGIGARSPPSANATLRRWTAREWLRTQGGPA